MSDVTQLLKAIGAGDLKMRYFVGMTDRKLRTHLGYRPGRWTGTGPSPGRG